MRSDTLFRRYELFVCGAIVAAHANGGEKGFRQRDVRFLIELFTNWIEFSLDQSVLSLSNTQVLRYLEELTSEGFVRKLSRKSGPHYRLTRIGLIELVTRMRVSDLGFKPENFYFLHYFLESYKDPIEKLVESEGKKFPLALKLEVDSLFDTNDLVNEQIARVSTEVIKLRARVEEGKIGSQQSAKLFRQGKSLAEVAEAMEQSYPYGLNSQKPLSELMSSIPAELGKWELEEGTANRVKYIWEPMLSMIEKYLQALKGLS